MDAHDLVPHNAIQIPQKQDTAPLLVDHESHFVTTDGHFPDTLWETIRAEREQFFHGAEANLQHVRPHILRSWERSRNANVPLNGSPNPLLTGRELRELLERNAFLVECAESIIETLLADMVAARSCIILTDANGVYLHTTGYSPGFSVGASCPMRGLVSRESIDGTTSMGICLEEKAAVCVLGSEHYTPWYDGWACSSAPIFNHDNVMVGSLSLAIERDRFHFHTFRLVVAAARAITEKMQTMRLLHEQQVIMDLLGEAVVMLDDNGSIRMLNRHAKNMLQLSDSLEDCPLPELTELSLDTPHPQDCTMRLDNGRRIRCAVTSTPVHGGGRCIVMREWTDRRAERTPYRRQVTSYTFDHILGQSAAMRQTLEAASNAAETDLPMLILGESGTGKELFAQSIHHHSPRRHQPFVTINCGAIPDNLIQSELFGYEPGAFTGASPKGGTGKFMQAHGGTLFLDEIGDMPLTAQTSLLRVLQEGEVTKLGGKRPTPVDVRVIAATHRDLASAVRQGTFRQDLYYRLHVLAIHVPPLRERGEDIAILARHFLRTTARKLNKVIHDLDDGALETLRAHHWPGNVRELEHLLSRAILGTRNTVLTRLDMTQAFVPASGSGCGAEIASKNLPSSVASADSPILAALQQTGGNIQAAAKLAGTSRVTVYAYIRKHGVDLRALRHRVN